MAAQRLPASPGLPGPKGRPQRNACRSCILHGHQPTRTCNPCRRRGFLLGLGLWARSVHALLAAREAESLTLRREGPAFLFGYLEGRRFTLHSDRRSLIGTL